MTKKKVYELVDRSVNDLGVVDFSTGMRHFAEMIKAVIEYIEQRTRRVRK